MRLILSTTSSGAKIFYLFLFSFIGLFAASFFLQLVMRVFDVVENTAIFVYVSSFIQAFFLFLIPSYLLVRWSFEDVSDFFKINNGFDFRKKVLFGISVFIASYIFVGFIALWNKELHLPESLSGIEQWMRDLEDAAQKTTDMLLSGKSVYTLILNLLVVAVLAAVSEEFFFRGVLQQLLINVLKNAHIAVWLSAFIFSAMHVQFFGFFPRWILGALLGYLFLYTRNLWIPIVIHFLNNAVVIVLSYFGSQKGWIDKVENIPFSFAFVVLAVLSLLCTLLLFGKYKKCMPDSNYFSPKA